MCMVCAVGVPAGSLFLALGVCGSPFMNLRRLRAPFPPSPGGLHRLCFPDDEGGYREAVIDDDSEEGEGAGGHSAPPPPATASATGRPMVRIVQCALLPVLDSACCTMMLAMNHTFPTRYSDATCLAVL
jgi:hypothetical protein